MLTLLISFLILLLVLGIVVYFSRMMGLGQNLTALLCLVLLVLFLIYIFQGGALRAQTANDACAVIPAGTTFVVTGGQRPRLLWLLPATVPANPPDDMTLVSQRVNGFYIQLNQLTRVETGVLVPVTCPAGNANAGKLGYMFQYPTTVPAGKHQFSVRGWNFVKNADGTETTNRQEGTATVVPFTAADIFQIGPPSAPENVSVIR